MNLNGLECDERAYREYAVRELRAAWLRNRIVLNEIEYIGKSLKGGFITVETAMAWLSEAGALQFVAPDTDQDSTHTST